jgi:protein-tyrosine phosphatase
MLEVITGYINDHYGSKRGLLHHWRSRLQYQAGGFSACKEIDWSRVENFVFICHGNICRSPLGEAVAIQKFNLRAESYGLDCRDGAPADPRAQQFAKTIDIDLAQHCSRHIRSYKPALGDLVVAMEPRHLLQLPPHIASIAQISLVGLWMTCPQPYIHDPYNTGAKYFERCEQLVVSGVEGVANVWQSYRR